MTYPFRTDRLANQLKAGLSATAHDSDNEKGPSVSKLAERINAIKAVHRIEATPQRDRQKQFLREEPVTARIRRRTEAISASDPAIQPAATASGAEADLSPEAGENPASEPMTFQERIAMERRRNEGPENTL